MIPAVPIIQTHATIESSLSNPQCSLSDQLRPMEITGWPREFTKKCCLFTDSWEITERLVRPLSARWEITEHSLRAHFPQRLFWTSPKFDGDHGDHRVRWKITEKSWKTLKITECSLKDGEIFHICGHSMVSPLRKGGISASRPCFEKYDWISLHNSSLLYTHRQKIPQYALNKTAIVIANTTWSSCEDPSDFNPWHPPKQSPLFTHRSLERESAKNEYLSGISQANPTTRTSKNLWHQRDVHHKRIKDKVFHQRINNLVLDFFKFIFRGKK